MIPFEFDDGFSIPNEYGFVRPMLADARIELKHAIKFCDVADTSFLLDVPYFHQTKFDDYIPVEVRSQLITEVLKGIDRPEFNFKKLRSEIKLLVDHSGMMELSCADCRAFATNPETGSILVTQSGAPILRKLPVPCEVTSCVKGHWRDPVTVSKLTLKVWKHYWQMRAARIPTSCPIMARNWAFIEWVVFHGRRAELNPFPSGGYPGSSGNR
jgi:hypothetical protein